MSASRESLHLRAARYFGYEDTPRRSIRLNNESCVIVAAGAENRTVIMYYSEAPGRHHGEIIRFTERALRELLEALGARGAA